MSTLLASTKAPNDRSAPQQGQRISALDGWRGHLPFLISSAIYSCVTVAILIASYHLTSGHFVYALDDTYINMAMAKNFALHGVWGGSPYEFSSSSSTPLYVLLLSFVYWVVGPSQYAPLFLSWVFGLASIFVAAQILAEHLIAVRQTAVLAAIVLLTPLFAIGMLGMEHTLHLFLTLLFVQRFDRSNESTWIIATITALMVATRYEGLFMATIGCLILIVLRRWTRAASVVVAAWLPVAIYAIFSTFHKGYWLPNSVAIKGIQIHGLALSARIVNVLMITSSHCFRGAHLFFLLAGTLVAALSLRNSRPRVAAMLFLIVGAGYLHLIAADIGWAYRYEDYLLGSGILGAACAFPLLRGSSRRVSACLFVCAGAFLLGRAVQAAASLPQYSRAIYLQQWQTAAFLKTYYPGAAVAANDIGAINFRSDLRSLDLVGLADSDVFFAKRAGAYSTQFMDHETAERSIEIAIIYDSWFSVHPQTRLGGPPIPASWIRVRRWRVPQKEQLGDDTVSFYALTPDATRSLQERLRAFESILPKNVTVTP
jgi:hypothetical protein